MMYTKWFTVLYPFSTCMKTCFSTWHLSSLRASSALVSSFWAASILPTKSHKLAAGGISSGANRHFIHHHEVLFFLEGSCSCKVQVYSHPVIHQVQVAHLWSRWSHQLLFEAFQLASRSWCCVSPDNTSGQGAPIENDISAYMMTASNYKRGNVKMLMIVCPLCFNKGSS